MSLKERVRSELPRPSTWFLALVFLLALVLYVLVRPVEPGTTGTPATLVPAATLTPEPRATPSPSRSSHAPVTRPPSSHAPTSAGTHAPSLGTTPAPSAALTPVPPTGQASGSAAPPVSPVPSTSPTP